MIVTQKATKFVFSYFPGPISNSWPVPPGICEVEVYPQTGIVVMSQTLDEQHPQGTTSLINAYEKAATQLYHLYLKECFHKLEPAKIQWQVRTRVTGSAAVNGQFPSQQVKMKWQRLKQQYQNAQFLAAPDYLKTEQS